MQKMIIKYYDLATTSESKLKATKEEAKLKEEMTGLCKSFDARIVKKDKIFSQEHDWAVDALSKLNWNEVLMKLLDNKIEATKGRARVAE